MAKTEEKDPADPAEGALVSVVLSCVYSGLSNETPGPGDTISVDAEEADRLIGLGVATLAPAAPEAAAD